MVPGHIHLRRENYCSSLKLQFNQILGGIVEDIERDNSMVQQNKEQKGNYQHVAGCL